MKTNYENPTHKEQCIINAQADYDYAKKSFENERIAAGILPSTNWFVGSGPVKLNAAYTCLATREAVYNAVLEALKVTPEQAQAMTDAYNRYWENHA